MRASSARPGGQAETKPRPRRAALRRGNAREVAQSEASRHAQEIRSEDEHEDRLGRSLVTADHGTIMRWAEARGAVPATVPGTQHGDRLGVLRLDFPGYGGDDLVEVSWEEWFATFDERQLIFVYQEHTTDGQESNFFRLDNPEREDG